MFIYIYPDGYGRAPEIDFDEKKYEWARQKGLPELVVEEFDCIPQLINILLSVPDTARFCYRRIGKDKIPTKTWYFKCLNSTLFIDDHSVARTNLFKSWGLSVVLTQEKGKLKLHNGFIKRPYSSYEGENDDE